jgi:nucleoside-diphosphate-sugar epimerase
MHVADVVEIISRVVQLRIKGTYNCASQSNVSFSEIALTAIAAFGSSSNVCFDTEKVDVPNNIFATDDELFQRIDYYPKITLSQGLTREAARRKVVK